jgi:hypothetical protein
MPLAPPPIATAETEVTPAGATHVKVPAVVKVAQVTAGIAELDAALG